ncbi:MAG: hypothetical protein SFY80_04590 [Verrucomicrobiota bacterium]|nr:hypothetical protein [Verrucomicrobiota bacterium]
MCNYQKIRGVLVTGLLTVLATLPVIAQEKPDIRKLMPAEQQTAAGIDQLKPEQIAVLNAWLDTHFTQTEAKTQAVVQQKVEERIAEEKKKIEVEKSEEARSFFGLNVFKSEDLQQIESRVVGDCFGWDGDTIFVLENGQIWRQRLQASYYKKMKNPAVKLEKRALGYWLTLKDTGASCPVKRVK